ncbi:MULTISPECIES: phosphoribosylformylglycinamidine synthase subunit PurS [Carboxydothermus]|uniref:Phosphoribosylformylglycinamidine synthase subunit PurS n=2 Tax=Carboxydothermus TaxID=129957 RepID=Q3AD66_CARHZ|nr:MULTISPECIES: phosphoribosylformylglycinamidine synthase subunit PurS [Carboxydothermus]ABB13718.1 phosphoribosylformylglycinamidine synthase, purS protein [Carboxydothermus hydrogenoformans Z-2901]NYE56967.1 phosphoribosylformylglycinamidine synthase [Carboxydothermus ferrireducens DSM 11255]
MAIARVIVELKPGVLDPQGEAIKNSLHALGYEEVKKVRVGKFITLEVEGNDLKEIEERVKEMADKLLANVVIEKFTVQVEG